MKKVLISGYIGFDNFGDELIFDVLLNHLKDLDFDVSTLSNKNYNIKTYRRMDIIKAVLNCDMVISGGGSLLQNKTSNLSLLYYLFIIFFAKICFKKVIIFAQGFEHIKGFFYQKLTKLALLMCDFVSVRDDNSKKLLDKWNVKSILLSDPSYSYFENVKINPNKEGLIVQLRSVDKIKPEFLDELSELIIKNYKEKITVLALHRDFDEKICLEFCEKLKNKGIEADYKFYQNINETIDLINNAKYVISTRLHGLICASALKSQTFALCYDNKVSTLANELNLLGIDIYNYDFLEFENKINKFFKDIQIQNQYRKFDWDKINFLFK